MNNIPSMNKIVSLIKQNFINNMVCASLSYQPDYRYYWIRDSALVYRSLIDIYLNTNKLPDGISTMDNKDKFEINSKDNLKENLKIEDFIIHLENETKIQNLNTLTGLGEPKINIDFSAFNENWGRPQNDGPALRGLNMINIYNLLKKKNFQKICDSIILPIINKDLEYTCKNLKKPSFDLWEEFFGWHFYTRIVQLKFLKEATE